MSKTNLGVKKYIWLRTALILCYYNYQGFNGCLGEFEQGCSLQLLLTRSC